MPRIAGGMMAKANPSWIDENFIISSPTISGARRDRSLKFPRLKKIVPVFGVLVNCSTFNPGNCTAPTIPSVLNARSVILRITASVRSRDEPSGSLTPPMRYSLSWVGMNPPGTVRNRFTAPTTSAQ